MLDLICVCLINLGNDTVQREEMGFFSAYVSSGKKMGRRCWIGFGLLLSLQFFFQVGSFPIEVLVRSPVHTPEASFSENGRDYLFFFSVLFFPLSEKDGSIVL